jgi:hypothetical protein
MMVKNTWRKRLTAFINTAKRYNHASPVIVRAFVRPIECHEYEKGRNELAIGPVGASAKSVVGTLMRSCVCRLLDGLDAES